MNRARGSAAEDAALRYLETQGCALIERNYRCRLGELDLVMRDGDSLVFVEVRARASEAFGGAGAGIGFGRRCGWAAPARHFLMTHPRAAALPARFDVVVITGRSGDDMPCWIRAAFDGAS
jgi:putative endonuclease